MGQVQNFVDEGVDWKGLGVVDIEDEHFADEPQSSGSELVAVEPAKPSIAYMPPAEMPDLDDMNEGMNIAPKYWEVEEKGATLRAYLIGWSTMKSTSGKLVDMAVLQNRSGIWTSSGTNLVQQLRNISLGTALQITFSGKEKTNNGFWVKKYDVRMLNPKPALPDMNIGQGVKIKSKQPA
jgi:hypothetical protein